MTTVQVVLTMCATYDFNLEQLDAKTAFLHENLEKEIYMLQLEGFEQPRKENLFCRLNKSLYGLKQAPRCPNKDPINKLKAQLAKELKMRDLRPTNKILGIPDIAHAMGVVSRYMAEPDRENREAVKRILRCTKGTSDVALCYGKSNLTVTGYVDFDYASDLDESKSTIRYVFTHSAGTDRKQHGSAKGRITVWRLIEL
nr:hypothetical protein [Tanacetum cinerariifolium]